MMLIVSAYIGLVEGCGEHFIKLDVNQTATEITGCYSQTYSWCSSTHQVPLVVYAFSMIVIMGSALPIAFIPINTLYSKILGNRRQVNEPIKDLRRIV